MFVFFIRDNLFGTWDITRMIDRFTKGHKLACLGDESMNNILFSGHLAHH